MWLKKMVEFITIEDIRKAVNPHIILSPDVIIKGRLKRFNFARIFVFLHDYFVSNQQESTSVTEISNVLMLNRGTVYDVCRELRSLGIIYFRKVDTHEMDICPAKNSDHTKLEKYIDIARKTVDV